MDEATTRAMLEQNFTSSDDDLSPEMYHDDAVLEFRQSGECWNFGGSILEFGGDKIADEWRAQRRSAP
jgi:hypothetical protein